MENIDLGEYERWLLRTKTTSTVRGYLYSVGKFLEWLDGRTLSGKALDRYISHLEDGGNAPRSITRHVYAIRSYFKHLDLESELKNVVAPRFRVKEPDYITREELDALVGACTLPRDRAMVMLLYDAALRVGELVSIKKNDVDFRRLELKVTSEKARGGEMNVAVVPVCRKTANALKEHLRISGGPGEWMFAGREGRLTSGAVRERLKTLSAAAGIRHVHPHMLRHCLHPDTLIYTPDGPKTAKEMYFLGKTVWSVDTKNASMHEGRISESSHHITNLYDLWAGGRNLLCSPEHRVFKVHRGKMKEVAVRELKIGDYIAGIKKYEVSPHSYMNPDIWKLLGYFVGDGYFHARRVYIYDKNPAVLEHYKRISNVHFGTGKLSKCPAKNSYRLSISSKTFEDLIDIFDMKVTSHEKRCPDKILVATEDEVCSFIAGYFDADGTSSKVFEAFFSVSRQMLMQVQAMLLRLGINSTLSRRKRTVTLPQDRIFTGHIYILHIIDKKSRAIFRQKIHPAKPLRIVSVYVREVGCRDIIPVSDLIKEIYERRKKTGERVIWGRCELKKFTRLNPPRNKLLKLLPHINTEPEAGDIRTLVESKNVIWLKVTKIIKRDVASRHNTYDFEVPEYHTLVTNGIISHNSRATHAIQEMGGAALPFINKLLRHSSFETTMIYTHLASADIKKGVPSAFPDEED